MKTINNLLSTIETKLDLTREEISEMLVSALVVATIYILTSQYRLAFASGFAIMLIYSAVRIIKLDSNQHEANKRNSNTKHVNHK